MDYFKSKNIFLTGASSGIGEAVAKEMARRGAIVGLLARRESELERIRDEIVNAGGRAEVYACDVVDRDAVKAAVDKFVDPHGPVDILFANAGIGGNDKRTRSLEPDAVAKVIDINLKGTVNAVSAVLGGMKQAGAGQIVGVSSLAGFRGLPRSAAYSASKAGMTAFLESVRLDLINTGIEVTIIQPGFIKTPLTSGRANKMPFIMELEDSVPYFLNAIEKRKRFSAFPWQLASLVRAARFFPAFLYDRIAGRVRYRE